MSAVAPESKQCVKAPVSLGAASEEHQVKGAGEGPCSPVSSAGSSTSLGSGEKQRLDVGKRSSAHAKPAASSADTKRQSGNRKPKKGSKAAKRTRALRVHRAVRWAVQVAFFLLAPSVFSAAFNGIKYAAGQIGLRQAVEPTSFVMLLVGVLLFTVLFGRFFCGYACAFGTLGDAVYALFTPVRKALRIPDFPLPQKVQRGLQFVKFGVLAAICALCFTGAWQAVSGYSPWTAFAGIVAGSVDGISIAAFVVLGVIVLGMALVKRFFCQFLCPLGAVFALMPVLPTSQFNRCAGQCGKRCGKCQAGCPVGVYPDARSFAAGECISCGKCADVCPLSNVGMIHIAEKPSASVRDVSCGPAALGVGSSAGDVAVAAKNAGGAGNGPIGVSVSTASSLRAKGKADASYVKGAACAPSALRAKAGRKKVLLRGNEVAFTLAKTALLLLLLWVAGALSFAPSFAELTGIQLPWA